MVIGKHRGGANVDARVAQSGEKLLRIPDASDREHRTHRTWRTYRARRDDASRAARLAHAECPRLGPRRSRVGSDDHDDIRARRGIRPLAEAPKRKNPSAGNLADAGHEHVQVARERKVLEAIVQEVNGGAESALGNDAGEIPILRDDHNHARQLSRQHERLVARAIQVGDNRLPIRHHDGADVTHTAAISSTQNGGTLTALDEPLGNRRDERRLARPADAHVANADHRVLQTTSSLGMTFVPTSAQSGSLSVEEVKQWV
jgi:hypothetical protein